MVDSLFLGKEIFLVDNSRQGLSLQNRNIAKEYKDKRYIDYKEDKKMKLFLTNRCNLNCVYCFKDKRKKEPSLDEILSQIRKAKKRVLLKGGEALIRRDILKILDYAKTRNLRIDLETNAYFLTPKIIRLVNEIHLVFDSVNFHDWQKTTRNTRRVYNKILKNINLAVKAKKKIYLNVLLTTININSLVETKNFCQKNNITLRIFENPPVKGFEASNKLFVPIKKAKFLGKGVVYKKSKPKIFTEEKLKYRRRK